MWLAAQDIERLDALKKVYAIIYASRPIEAMSLEERLIHDPHDLIRITLDIIYSLPSSEDILNIAHKLFLVYFRLLL